MSQSGVNRAVTEEGAMYNKLRRPEDYLESLTAPVPPPPKRKIEAVEASAERGDKERKSRRLQETNALNGATRHIHRPMKENGMQIMFPELEDDSASGASDALDTTKDALDYLLSVRSEAATIPTLLVAPPQAPEDASRDRSIYENGVGDHRAVYQDGTWIAIDDDTDGEYSDEDDEDIDVQGAYYTSLLYRYQTLRGTLANIDQVGLLALARANPDNLNMTKFYSNWKHTFDNVFPTPIMVVQLNEDMLDRALRIVTEDLTMSNTISKQKGTWIWTLLAMAGEKGTLDYLKVGRIRELAKEAANLSLRLRGRQLMYTKAYKEDSKVWVLDDESFDGEGADGDIDMGEASEIQDTALAAKRHGQGDVDDEDHDPPTNISGQLNGSGHPNVEAPAEAADDSNGDERVPIFDDKGEIQEDRPQDNDEHTSISDDDWETQEDESQDNDEHMSVFDDDGEIQEDKSQDNDEPVTLEAARARLIAQLGDNLVSESIPDPADPARLPKAESSGPSQARLGGRHRHNSSVCRNTSYPTTLGTQEAHRKAELRAGQGEEASSSQPEQAIPKPDVSDFTDTAKAPAKAQATDSDPAVRATFPMNSKGPTRSPSHSINDDWTQSGEEQIGDDDEEESSDDASNDSKSKVVDLNTKATIDMILTVVGGYYGQKDLLNYREGW